ncbi:MAG: hypothetical protein U0R68_11495 [Candidatus Nanopelagicales bacterium]
MSDAQDTGTSAPLVPVVKPGAPGLPSYVQGPLDVALGTSVVVARPVVGVTVALVRAFTPLARDTVALVARPPLVPAHLTPAAWAEALAAHGRTVRVAGTEDLEVAGGEALDVVIPTVLERVLDRIDLTELVLQRVDLERIVGAVLDRMDLTEVVLERVELGRVINGALDQIDLNDLVRSRVDLASIAEEVIDDVDLPEIIRDSTTGVAGAVVDGTRLRAVEGDELVNRLVDRILLRRKARRTAAAGASLDEDTTLFGARPGEYAERIEETAQRQRAESEREAHEHHDVPDEARAADDTADDTAEGETRA